MKRVRIRSICILLAAVMLAACGGGGGTSNNEAPANNQSYTIGGTVSGLHGSGLVIQVNGANDYPVSSNGSFNFATMIDGSSYVVTVKTHPADPAQTCVVENGSGKVAGADVTNVAIVCTWTKQIGTTSGGGAEGSAVTTDGSGNVYVAGVTGGTLNGVATTGVKDLFLMKFTPAGSTAYTQLRGSTSSITSATAVAVDGSGNVFVAGTTAGTLDGNVKVGDNWDYVLLKYDASGNWVYTKQVGNGNTTFGEAVATDADGNVYVAGSTSGTLDGVSGSGGIDYFLAKYDAAGNKIYTKLNGGGYGSGTHAYAIAVDGDGNVFIAGDTNAPVLDGANKIGNVDYFLTKYDSAGNWIFTKRAGVASQGTSAESIAIDASGNLFVAGTTGWGTTTYGFDGTLLSGKVVSFVTKYNTNGNTGFTSYLGPASGGFGVMANSVASDPNGNIVLAGYVEGGLGEQPAIGYTDLFVAKFDPTGTQMFTSLLGAVDSTTMAYSVATDPSGNIFATGFTKGSLDGVTPADFLSDVFVLKYEASGALQ